MSATSTQTTETTAERKPPTLADIVREKTDDGRRIIDFFLDVMEDRIDGAELCHRIDAAKQLEKHRSKAAARFLAKYRGVPCGHSLRRSPGSADPCSAPVATGQVSAPGPFTQDFLTVLSAVDEDLMARLVRAQTADGSTVVEFLDDVMQDRNDGFKCHHRIAAAKELIVHIVRDEQPAPTPREPVPEQSGIPAESLPRTRYGAGTQGGGGGRSAAANSARTEPVEGSVRAEPVLSTAEGSAHPEPNSSVVPAQAGTHPPEPVEGPEAAEARSASPNPEPRQIVVPAQAGTHPPEPAEGRQDDKARRPRTRRTRTQRRREGAARAAMLGKHPTSERNKKDQQDKPAPVELTPAERRIRVRLEQHWHEPDPYGAPIDSTHPGRSPPW